MDTVQAEIKELKKLTIPTMMNDIQSIVPEAQETREIFVGRFDKLEMFMNKITNLPAFSTELASSTKQSVPIDRMMVIVTQQGISPQHMPSVSPHLISMPSPLLFLHSPVDQPLWNGSMTNDDN